MRLEIDQMIGDLQKLAIENVMEIYGGDNGENIFNADFNSVLRSIGYQEVYGDTLRDFLTIEDCINMRMVQVELGYE